MATQNVFRKAKQARELAWNGEFPVDPIAIAANLTIVKTSNDAEERLPIEMVGEPLGSLSGYAKFIDDGEARKFLCAYNTDEALVRQRFTQAHELGHVLLDHVSENRTMLRDTTFNAPAGKWEEIDANAFAAELIIPAEHLTHLAGRITNIDRLANYFGVSPTAIHYRLKNLGLI